jgi:plastocyanin
MRIPRPFRMLAPALLAPALLLAVSLAPAVANAGTVKGTVRLPEAARGGRQHRGYWRLENGTVPVRGASKQQAGAVVVIEGISGTHAPPARTHTVEITNLDATPRVVVVGPGSVVEFKNVGKITHELSTPGNSSLMPIERLNPGTFRHQKFMAPGGYLVRCNEYPHLAISVVVVDSSYNAVLTDKGAFNIPNVPDGDAKLKVWAMGRWIHQQAINVGSKEDLAIKVATPKDAKESDSKEPESKDEAAPGTE